MASVLTWVRRRLSGKSSKDIAAMIEQANAARDAHRWRAARDLYRNALAVRPERVGLWMQHGHALKHCGDLDGAIQSYNRALVLAPKRADTALQLGHAFKVKGELETARDWYVKALIWPGATPHARMELRSLGLTAEQIRSFVLNEDEASGVAAIDRRGPAVESPPAYWDVSTIVNSAASGTRRFKSSEAFAGAVSERCLKSGEPIVFLDVHENIFRELQVGDVAAALEALTNGDRWFPSFTKPLSVSSAVVVRNLETESVDLVPELVRWRTCISQAGGYARVTSDGRNFIAISEALGRTMPPLARPEEAASTSEVFGRPRWVRSPQDEIPALHSGLFYTLALRNNPQDVEFEANGQPYLWGNDWGPRSEMGRMIGQDSELVIRLLAPRLTPHVCRILWAYDVRASGDTDSPIWTSARILPDPESLTLSIALDPLVPGGRRTPFMIGFTVFPEDCPHYWFDLMHAAASRRLPSVTSLAW